MFTKLNWLNSNYLIKLIVLLPFLFSQLTFAQLSNSPNYKLRQISQADGLSSTIVTALINDKAGFMWFGTQDGLNQYDGYSFKIYRSDSKDSATISDNIIQSLFQDSEGIIWVGGAVNGLSSININTNKISRYKFNKELVSAGQGKIVSIIQDKNGIIWVGSKSGGLYYSNPQKTNFTKLKLEKEEFTISSLNCDIENNIWISAESGLFRLNYKKSPSEAEILPIKIPLKNEKLALQITASTLTNYNELWSIVNYNVIVRKSNRDLNFKVYDNFFDGSLKVENVKLKTIFCDTQGNIWAGTLSSGLFIKKSNSDNFLKVSNADFFYQESSCNNINAITQDKKGTIWLGTLSCGVLNFEIRKSIFKTYVSKNPTTGNPISENISSIFIDGTGKVWKGKGSSNTDYRDDKGNSFIKFTPKIDLTNSQGLLNVYCMQEDNNSLYFGSLSNGISIYNKKRQTLNYLRQNETQRLDPVSSISFTNNILFGTYGNGVFSIKKNANYNQNLGLELKKVDLKLNDFNINCLANYNDQFLLVGTEKGGVNVFDTTNKLISILNKNNGPSTISNSYVVCLLVDKHNLVWLGTAGDGIDIILNFNEYVTGKQSNLKIINLSTKQKIANNTVLGIIQDKSGNYWISTSNGLTRLIFNASLRSKQSYDELSSSEFYNSINVKNFDVNDGLPSNDFNTGAFARSAKDELFFGTSNGIFSFFPDSIKESNFIPPVVLTKFKIFENDYKLDTSITYKKQLNLTYKESFFSFEFASLSFDGGESDQYSYMMEGFDRDWINSGTRRFASYTNLDPKDYVFKVRIANGEGGWNPVGASIRISITPPWYKTPLAYFFFILVIIALFYFYIKWREVRLRTEKKILENKVDERTKEIAIINVEISKKNQDITDSINYAKRIQQAILPPLEELQDNFKDSFILYKPKDIVSGDFYWLFKSEFDNQEKQILIAAADCTGHGVPGAFMSMVSIDKLNEAAKYHLEPSKILEYVNVGIKSALRQSSEIEGQTRDGLDIALARIINLPNGQFELSFAGANRPLWILREGENEIEEVKATKAAIGGFTDVDQIFNQNKLILKSGDCFYLFSDGYPDQFGGENNKKFMTKKLKDLIIQNKTKTMFQQKIIFDTALKNWQGNYEQIDDVLVIGVRLSN